MGVEQWSLRGVFDGQPDSLAAWNKRGAELHQERSKTFSAIDELSRRSRILERYEAAIRAAGLQGYTEFLISDAHETAYGMGYPAITRTIMVIGEDLMDREDPLGAVLYQIDRGGGYEEPSIDLSLCKEAAFNFAKRYSGLTEEQVGTVRPYWFPENGIEARDITRPDDFRPGQAWLERDSGYQFAGFGDPTFTLEEIVVQQARIEEFFKGVTADLVKPQV